MPHDNKFIGRHHHLRIIRLTPVLSGKTMKNICAYITLSCIVFSTLVGMGVVHAHTTENITHEHITIIGPSINITSPAAPVASAYMMITNNSERDERLVAITLHYAEKSELHSMSINDGVMIMRPIDGGIIIPKGQTIALKSGGNHAMFMKLTKPLKEGETAPITLKFDNATPITIDAPIKNLAHQH